MDTSKKELTRISNQPGWSRIMALLSGIKTQFKKSRELTTNNFHGVGYAIVFPGYDIPYIQIPFPDFSIEQANQLLETVPFLTTISQCTFVSKRHPFIRKIFPIRSSSHDSILVCKKDSTQLCLIKQNGSIVSLPTDITLDSDFSVFPRLYSNYPEMYSDTCLNALKELLPELRKAFDKEKAKHRVYSKFKIPFSGISADLSRLTIKELLYLSSINDEIQIQVNTTFETHMIVHIPFSEFLQGNPSDTCYSDCIYQHFMIALKNAIPTLISDIDFSIIVSYGFWKIYFSATNRAYLADYDCPEYLFQMDYSDNDHYPYNKFTYQPISNSSGIIYITNQDNQKKALIKISSRENDGLSIDDAYVDEELSLKRIDSVNLALIKYYIQEKMTVDNGKFPIHLYKDCFSICNIRVGYYSDIITDQDISSYKKIAAKILKVSTQKYKEIQKAISKNPPLSPLESCVLSYINTHPGCTKTDCAEYLRKESPYNPGVAYDVINELLEIKKFNYNDQTFPFIKSRLHTNYYGSYTTYAVDNAIFSELCDFIPVKELSFEDIPNIRSRERSKYKKEIIFRCCPKIKVIDFINALIGMSVSDVNDVFSNPVLESYIISLKKADREMLLNSAEIMGIKKTLLKHLQSL